MHRFVVDLDAASETQGRLEPIRITWGRELKYRTILPFYEDRR
jgi:hypothetical protein